MDGDRAGGGTMVATTANGSKFLVTPQLGVSLGVVLALVSGGAAIYAHFESSDCCIRDDIATVSRGVAVLQGWCEERDKQENRIVAEQMRGRDERAQIDSRLARIETKIDMLIKSNGGGSP